MSAVEKIAALGSGLPEKANLGDVDHERAAVEIAEKLLDEFKDTDVVQTLTDAETEMTTDKDKYPLLLHLAVKLAKSRAIMQQFSSPVHVSVVFAMYKENNRMKTSAEHKNGEDFLRRKVAQLNWVTNGTQATWKMFAVDDGCPENSGQLAKDILAESKIGEDQVQVLFLKDGIEAKDAVCEGLTSTDDSRKGGSILYGMWKASQEEKPNHIIIFTDADLSTHLGQVGLLADGIINQGKSACIGSRRSPQSVVIKTGTRNTRGKLFIFLWKSLISTINYITDTQCGFKAWRADVAQKVVLNMIEKQFAFDLELLVKTEADRRFSISKSALVWIDSDAESTTAAMDVGPYLSMLNRVVDFYKAYHAQNDKSNEFGEFIKSLTEESWAKLVDNMPKEIAEGQPANFGTKDSTVEHITVADLKACLEKAA